LKSDKMSTLVIETVSVTRATHTLLHKISLTATAGQIIGLIGPNGAGKTTLLKAISQLFPYNGQMYWQDQPLQKLTRQQQARLIAYLAQTDEIHWRISVEQVVLLGRLPHAALWTNQTAQDTQAVQAAMQATDVLDLAHREVMTLSTGERARVMLARALAVQAPILLADEPAAALDPYHQLQVMEVLQQYAQQGRMVLVVLHDLTLAARFCEQLVLLHQGKIFAQGAPVNVLSPPHIHQVYQVEAVYGEQAGQTYVLPWSRMPDNTA